MTKKKLFSKAEKPHNSTPTLILEGWNYYDPNMSTRERGQARLYQEVMGRPFTPMFEVGSVGERQFNYTPQQKRGGKLPKEVLL